MVRLLVPLDGAAPSSAKVTGERLHYLAHVLRLREGDALQVFDGKGRAFPATVARLSADEAELALGPASAAPAPRPVTLVQGLPKADKLEWILQKGTELGASAFAPVHTERSVAQVKAERAATKIARWTRILEEAARQCGRSDVPVLHEPAALLAVVAALPATTRVLVLDEEERALSLSQAFAPLREDGAPLALVIGPEGGLTRGEVAALRECGGVCVTLGANVLRTETAALAALAVLRHLDGHLG